MMKKEIMTRFIISLISAFFLAISDFLTICLFKKDIVLTLMLIIIDVVLFEITYDNCSGMEYYEKQEGADK